MQPFQLKLLPYLPKTTTYITTNFTYYKLNIIANCFVSTKPVGEILTLKFL